MNMVSEGNQELIAEHKDLAEKVKNVRNMLKEWKEGTLKIVPKTPYYLFHHQLLHMESYLIVLEHRAEIEGVDFLNVGEE